VFFVVVFLLGELTALPVGRVVLETPELYYSVVCLFR
jgi:hypothetical protein